MCVFVFVCMHVIFCAATLLLNVMNLRFPVSHDLILVMQITTLKLDIKTTNLNKYEVSTC